jgi:hypothetical protein
MAKRKQTFKRHINMVSPSHHMVCDQEHLSDTYRILRTLMGAIWSKKNQAQYKLTANISEWRKKGMVQGRERPAHHKVIGLWLLKSWLEWGMCAQKQSTLSPLSHLYSKMEMGWQTGYVQ